MVKFYVSKIKDGEIMLGDVPKKWRAAVEEALNS